MGRVLSMCNQGEAESPCDCDTGCHCAPKQDEMLQAYHAQQANDVSLQGMEMENPSLLMRVKVFLFGCEVKKKAPASLG